jgi:hypothetical protein
MRPLSLLAALTVPFLALETVQAPGALAQARDTVQWKVTGVRYCSRADSLFGRFWRSHSSSVRTGYSRERDVTTIRTPDRKLSWQMGASRLVGSEAIIQVHGRDARTDSARIELYLRFVDSIYRSAEQAHVDLQVDDSVHMQFVEPQVDYPMGARISGIPLVVTITLTPEQSLALARAREVKGSMGPYSFILYDWEVWDINAVYRGTVCGVS